MRNRNKCNAVSSLERPKSLSATLMEFVNVPKVKHVVRLGFDVFNSLMPFVEEPGYMTGLKSAFAIGKVFVDDLEFWSDEYFAGEEWSIPYTLDFNGIILKAISRFPYETLKSSDESSSIRIVDIDGIKAGYVLKTKLGTVDNVYVETDHLAAAREKIKSLLWEMYKDSNLVMRSRNEPRRSNGYGGYDEGRSVVLEHDDAFNVMTSKRASEYSVYLKKCIDAGVNRSVMLYGPPGTGKSTMARTIINALNMRSFRIRVEDIASLSSATIFEALSIFEPDAIVLDDFDRSMSQPQLLETLEYFQRHVKLVIATVNNRNELDEAILRPGRFDELVLINKMDDDVVMSVLGEEYKDAFDVVKEWPIAFIQEYVKRRKFMNSDEAIASTEELALRVKRLERYNDVDDTERMSRLLARKKKVIDEVDDAEPLDEDVDDDAEKEQGDSGDLNSTVKVVPLRRR